MSEPIKDNTNNACISCKGACCSNCPWTHGYFKDSELGSLGIKDELRLLNPHQTPDVITKSLEVLRKHWGAGIQWDITNGFLTAAGCSIPREHRSKTCREYLCDYVKRVGFNDHKGRVEYWHKERVKRGLDIL